MFQVIFALAPLLTFFFAILHRQESFQWKVLIGGLLATAGIAIVFHSQLSADIPLLSLLAIILAAACSAEAIVLFKTFPKAHPVTTNAVAMAVGALVLFDSFVDRTRISKNSRFACNMGLSRIFGLFRLGRRH